MTNTDYEAVHPNDVFGANSVPVVFQFTTGGRTTGRSVQTDSNATVTNGQLNNTRVVKYTSTAKLVDSAGPLSPSFPFVFELTFQGAQ
jgi:hypothetical protein